MILHLASLGYPITKAQQTTPLYNDNEACLKWCHNLTTIGNHHIEHRENATHEWVADGTIAVTHISSKCNLSDKFTKEMWMALLSAAFRTPSCLELQHF
jgi:hypothetical protein